MDTGGAPSSGPVCGSTSNAWVFMPNLAACPGQPTKVGGVKCPTACFYNNHFFGTKQMCSVISPGPGPNMSTFSATMT